MKVRLLGAVAAVLLAVTACSSADGSPAKPVRSELNDQSGTGPYAGIELDPALPRPAFTLTDTAGKTYSFASTAGRATLLFFGYTRCPDVCPATMADIGNALRSLPAATQRNITVVFVTTDVKHDTSAAITKWLSQFTPGSTATFVGLRGTQSQVDAAEASSHIPLADDGGTTHSSEVLLYGPDNYAHDSFAATNTEQKKMEHDIPVVLSTS